MLIFNNYLVCQLITILELDKNFTSLIYCYTLSQLAEQISPAMFSQYSCIYNYKVRWVQNTPSLIIQLLCLFVLDLNVIKNIKIILLSRINNSSWKNLDSSIRVHIWPRSCTSIMIRSLPLILHSVCPRRGSKAVESRHS